MWKFARVLFTFQGLLWTITLAGILFLGAFPLARNLWAYYTWQRVPCLLSREGLFPPNQRKYFFERNGIRFSSDARDFWAGTNLAAGRSLGTERLDPPNTICYVSPGDPPSAVLFLDAHQRLDRAAPQLAVATLLIVATALLSRAARRRRPAASAANPAKGAAHG